MNFEEFRALFPALERVAWLNTATAAPGCRPVLEAVAAAHREWEDATFSWQSWEGEAEATRPAFAKLIGADPSCVALIPALSHGAGIVATSLPVGRVVVGEREFRSNWFPWLALQEKGFDFAPVAATDGVVSTEALMKAVDDETVLVAVSEVQSSTGYRVRLEDLAQRCREVGARLFVNLTQSVGALRFDVNQVQPDFAACHGYKWLLGPRGAGWMYVAAHRLDELRPLPAHWKSVDEPYEQYYGGELKMANGARRLDTSLAWFSWVGAAAGLRVLDAMSPAAVEERCLGLASSFREAAKAHGFRVVPQDAQSHIVGVVVSDAQALSERLRSNHVVAAVRGGFLRLGFHAFNNENDVSLAIKALGSP